MVLLPQELYLLQENKNPKGREIQRFVIYIVKLESEIMSQILPMLSIKLTTNQKVLTLFFGWKNWLFCYSLFSLNCKSSWFFDKSRALSQTKVKNNTSFGRFYFQLLSDHGICQRTK